MTAIFIEKIDILFKLLGCTNTDIAECMECSPSNVSRLRTGARKYSPTDTPILRFAEGVFLYADKENILSELCLLCGAENSSRDTLVPVIIGWLYGSDKTDISQLRFNHIKKKKSIRSSEIRSFGERLNNVLILLELSNARLAKIINVDDSLISRFRSGMRSPKSNPQIMVRLAETLYIRAENKGKTGELAKLCKSDENTFGNKEIGLDVFSDWLYNHKDEKNLSKIEGLLNYLDEFSSERTPELPLVTSFLSKAITNSDKKVYWGIDGLREAALRFLGRAKECASELWLYSDEDTKWLTEDKTFFAKWYSLMLACVKNNVRVKIIHNVDRSSDEMISAIQSWLPLYMSGKIESYVCKRPRDMRFSHTFFINPNNECISSFHVSALEKMWYDYYCADEKQQIIEQEFENLLKLSEPLLNIYLNSEINPLVKKNYSNELTGLHTSLSLGTMPKELLLGVLERNDIDKAIQDKILAFAANQRKRIDYALQNGKVIELVPFPFDEDLFAERIPISISSSLCNTTLYYRAEEYAEHIKSVLLLLETNKNYIIYAVPQMLFDGIQLIRTEKSVTVIRSKPPYLAFEITEPLLRHAIDDYFQMLIEKFGTYRQDIKNKLLHYL